LFYLLFKSEAGNVQKGKKMYVGQRIGLSEVFTILRSKNLGKIIN